MLGKPALLCVCLALLTGCGSGNSSDANVERDIRRGLAEIQSIHDRKALQAKLTAVVASLRGDQASSDSTPRARRGSVARFGASARGLGPYPVRGRRDDDQIAFASWTRSTGPAPSWVSA